MFAHLKFAQFPEIRDDSFITIILSPATIFNFKQHIL